MTVFAVYCPKKRDPLDAPEALRFVPERPSFWALIVPPVWLVLRGVWLGLLFWLAASAALFALTRGLPPGLTSMLQVLFAVWFAFSARDIEQVSLSLLGWRCLGVVEAPNRAAAERRWFEAAVAPVPVEVNEPFGGDRRIPAGVIGFEGFGEGRR